jgi:hypothetical protein
VPAEIVDEHEDLVPGVGAVLKVVVEPLALEPAVEEVEVRLTVLRDELLGRVAVVLDVEAKLAGREAAGLERLGRYSFRVFLVKT